MSFSYAVGEILYANVGSLVTISRPPVKLAKVINLISGYAVTISAKIIYVNLKISQYATMKVKFTFELNEIKKLKLHLDVYYDALASLTRNTETNFFYFG